MPIYTVREVTGSAKPDPNLKARGLDAKAVTLTHLDPIGMADYPQVAYSLYSKLLPAFMLATQANETLPTNRPGYNLISKTSDSIVFPFPPVCVSFKNALTDEQQESLKALGAGIIAGKNPKDHRYSFGSSSVTTELLNTLHKHRCKVENDTITPMGSVNLQVVQTQMKLIGIVTWFLKTHVYPAFTGPMEEDSDLKHAYDEIEGFMSLKRKAGSRIGGTKKARLEEDAEDQDMDIEVDEFGVIEEALFGDASSRVPKAKPSVAPETIMGTYHELPTMPGLCFPYFEGMIQSDGIFISTVIRTYFLECLGDTRDAILAQYQQVKRCVGPLGNTEIGRMIAHLFLGIKLSIETQTRLFPITSSDRYVGFAIQGYHFQVSIDGYKHSPLRYEELVKEATNIDEHNVAFAKIIEKLAKLKLTSGKSMPKKDLIKEKNQITSPRALAGFIRRFDYDAEEALEIEKLATSLWFPQRFWPITTENILKAVSYLIDEEFPPEDLPMYPRGGVLTTQDPKLSVFALFGDQAFSLQIGGGTLHKIPKDVPSDVMFKTYMGKGGKMITPKPTIIVARRSLSICLEDWATTIATKAIRSKQVREAVFKSVLIGGESAKVLWHGLIKTVGGLEADTTQDIAADSVELGEDTVEDVVESWADFL